MAKNTVGEILRKPNVTFEWRIADFSLHNIKNTFYCSPTFEFGDVMWRFALGCRTFETIWVCLNLRKGNCEFLTEDFTVSIKNEDGGNCLSKRRSEIEYDRIHGWIWFVEKPQFLKVVNGGGNPTISCSFSDATTANTGVNKLAQDLKNLLLCAEDTDVTLKVKDREFRAQKAILRARSPVFRSMFKHDMVEKSRGVVDIPDCDPDAFQVFLLYLYSGIVEKITSSNVLGLYTAADKYDVQDLKTVSVKAMIKLLSVETFCDFAVLALQYNETTLLKAAVNFFQENTGNIIATVKWLTFLRENPVAANEFHIKALGKHNTNLNKGTNWSDFYSRGRETPTLEMAVQKKK